MEEKTTIDISNMTSEQFVEYMHELDKKNTCPCVGCEKCQIRMQRHECPEFKAWAFRHVVHG